MRPKMGFWSGTVEPVDTSMMSAPCSCERARDGHASSGPSLPPGAQSVAEMRTEIGRSLRPGRAHGLEHLEREASRFSSEPPYASVRRFVSGERKLASR